MLLLRMDRWIGILSISSNSIKCIEHGQCRRAEKFLQYSRENQFLGALEDRKCVLSPEDFLELFLPGQCGCIEGADAESLRKHLPGVFSELLSSPDVDAFCEDMTFQPKPYKDWNLTAAVDRYKEQKGWILHICIWYVGECGGFR